MYTAIIISNKRNDIKFMFDILNTFKTRILIIAVVKDILSAKEYLRNRKPDLIFINEDAHASEFEKFIKLITHEGIMTVIVATANYFINNKIIKQCKWLIRPFKYSDMEKIISELETNKLMAGNLTENKTITVVKPYKLAISNMSTINVVDIDDIVYCSGDGTYTRFYMKQSSKSSLVSSKNLKVYEDLLAGYGFFRIHKSYLINLKEVVQYLKSDGGSVRLSNNICLEVSQKKRNELLHVLAEKILCLL